MGKLLSMVKFSKDTKTMMMATPPLTIDLG